MVTIGYGQCPVLHTQRAVAARRYGLNRPTWAMGKPDDRGISGGSNRRTICGRLDYVWRIQPSPRDPLGGPLLKNDALRSIASPLAPQTGSSRPIGVRHAALNAGSVLLKGLRTGIQRDRFGGHSPCQLTPASIQPIRPLWSTVIRFVSMFSGPCLPDLRGAGTSVPITRFRYLWLKYAPPNLRIQV